MAVAAPAGAVARQVTVSDPSPSDFVAPRPPPPPRSLYLGASITTNSPTWSQVLPRSGANGALVLSVVPASPALVAGLVPGDLIVGIDDRRIRNDEQVVTSIRSSVFNDLAMTVLGPDGARKTIVAHLERRAAAPPADAQQELGGEPGPVSRLLYARAHPDPGVAVTVLDQLIDKLPGFAEAHALRSQRLLELAISEHDHSPERTGAIRAAAVKATGLDPDSLHVLNTAARVLVALGDGSAAERAATQAVTIDDESAQAHHLLGTTRLASRRPAQALPDLHRAVELDPYAEDGYQDLSACYTALGQQRLATQTDHALAQLRTAHASTSSTAPGHPWAVAVAAVAAFVVGGLVPLARRTRRPGPAQQPEGREPVRPRRLWVLEALSALALLSIVLPAVGHRLALSAGAPLSTEVVDHALPGLAILVLCGTAMRLELRGEAAPDWVLFVALGVILAGLWMTATHLHLVADAYNGRATFDAAVTHASPGPVTVILGVLLYQTHTHPPTPRPSHNPRTVTQRSRPPASRRKPR